jgi:hypothetical protein
MLKQQKSIPRSQFLLSSLSLQQVSSPVIMMEQGKNQLKMNYKASNLCVYFENNFCRSTILFPFWSQKTHICSPSFCSISFYFVYVLKRVSIVRTSNCNDPTSRSIPVRETNHRPAISVVALQQSFALHIEKKKTSLLQEFTSCSNRHLPLGCPQCLCSHEQHILISNSTT